MLAEDISKIIGEVAKILDPLTGKEQVNAAGKSIEKMIDSLTKLTLEDKIDTDMFFEKINDLQVNKKFDHWRGKMKEMKIILGDTSTKKD